MRRSKFVEEDGADIRRGRNAERRKVYAEFLAELPAPIWLSDLCGQRFLNILGVLGLPYLADRPQAEASFRMLRPLFHPDTVVNDAREQSVRARRFVEISQAFEELTDPSKCSLFVERVNRNDYHRRYGTFPELPWYYYLAEKTGPIERIEPPLVKNCFKWPRDRITAYSHNSRRRCLHGPNLAKAEISAKC